MSGIIEIPGDYLEGGGQILRTSLSLSAITQKPVRIYNIRGKREHPGLKPQHFSILKAMTQLYNAKCEGLSIGSREISFYPSFLKTQNVEIDIGTSGAIGLVLQSLILPLSLSRGKIDILLKGGTSGKGAMPIEYFQHIILPVIKKIGAEVKIDLIKRGYYPKGGGIVKATVAPIKEFKPFELVNRSRILKIGGISHASNFLKERGVAERQERGAREILEKKFSCPVEIKSEYSQTLSPGSGIVLWAETENGTFLGADAIGERGKLAERVGIEAAHKLVEEYESGAVVDRHLADNLIPWLALVGGKIKISSLTLHAETNIWVCQKFIGDIFGTKDNVIVAEKGVGAALLQRGGEGW